MPGTGGVGGVGTGVGGGVGTGVGGGVGTGAAGAAAAAPAMAAAPTPATGNVAGGATANTQPDANPQEKKRSVVPAGFEVSTASSAQNPLDRMVKIAKDPDLSDDDKANLILYARNNLKNRRKMAYICLYVIVGSFGLLFLAAFVDGISGSTAILSGITGNQTLFGSTLVQISLLSDVSRGGGTFVRLGLGSGL